MIIVGGAIKELHMVYQITYLTIMHWYGYVGGHFYIKVQGTLWFMACCKIWSWKPNPSKLYSKVHRVAATTSLHLSTPQTLQLWCKYQTYRSHEVTCMFKSVGATFCTPILQFLQQISCVFSPLNFENGVRNQPLRSARKCRAEVNWSFFPLKQTNLLVLCRDYVENTL